MHDAAGPKAPEFLAPKLPGKKDKDILEDTQRTEHGTINPAEDKGAAENEKKGEEVPAQAGAEEGEGGREKLQPRKDTEQPSAGGTAGEKSEVKEEEDRRGGENTQEPDP